jgi:A/G-specific adenine glycosylase
MKRSSHSGENKGGSRGRHNRPILSAADKRRLVILRRALLQFFEKHHRSYPWRHTENWFHLLMAEMMLRRTRAEQVLPVYEKFTDRYKTAADALADGMEVREMLRPLGLGWRNEAIFHTLEYLRDHMAVRELSAAAEIDRIPGVGEYSNGMLRSILFAERVPAIDTNVVRILCRFDGLPEKGEMRRSPLIKERAAYLVDTDHPAQVNLALIDFGAMVCTARNPDCKHCPVRRPCRYS